MGAGITSLSARNPAVAHTGTYATLGMALKKPTAVGLGDSITMSNTVASTGTYGENFLMYLHGFSGQKLQFMANKGVSGNTVAQMVARLQTDVIALAPGWCHILAGTNDMKQSLDFATSAGLYENSLIKPLRAANIEPIIGTIPPYNSASAAQNKWLWQWNAFLRRLAAKYGLVLIDYHKALVDPSTSLYKTNYNTDDTHPSALGHLSMGNQAISDFSSHLRPYGPPLAEDDGSTINLLAHGLFMGALNGSHIPAGWSSGFNLSAGSPGTGSLVAATGTLIGNWYQIAKQDNATAINVNQIVSSGFGNAGDKVAFMGKYEMDTPAGGVYCSVALGFRDASTATISSLTPISQFTQTISDYSFYMEGTIPAGTASLRMNIQTSTAGTGNLRFGQMTVLNLTALGIDTVV